MTAGGAVSNSSHNRYITPCVRLSELEAAIMYATKSYSPHTYLRSEVQTLGPSLHVVRMRPRAFSMSVTIRVSGSMSGAVPGRS